MSARRAAQPREKEPLMRWRAPRLPRAAHVALTLVVATAVVVAGAVLVGQLIASDELAFGVGLMWGVVVGMAAVAYWQEVIDR